MNMDKKTKKYMAEIGRKGGKKSRRTLDPETARMMVKVRMAQQAYKKYYVPCFWSYSNDIKITVDKIPWVVSQLRKRGDQTMWEVADRLCR